MPDTARLESDPAASEAAETLDSSAPSDMVWQTDSEHRLVYLSENLQNRLGLPLDELLGKRPWDIKWPNMSGPADALTHAPRDVMERHDAFNCVPGEICILGEDGQTKTSPCERSGFPRFDAKGRFEGYIGVTSERHAALRVQLERVEDRMRDFTNASAVWMWETDADHKYTFLSNSFERYAGFDLSDVLGRQPWGSLFLSGDPEIDGQITASNAAFWKAMKNRKAFRNLPGASVTKAGVIYVSRSGTPIFDASGDFAGFRCVTRDRTSKRQAELKEQALQIALQEREERFRDFASASSDYLVETDEDHCITYVGDSCAEHTGYSSEAFIGQCIWDAASVNRQDILAANASLWSALREHRSFRSDYGKVLTKAGEVIDVVRSGRPRFDGRGRYLGHRIVIAVCSTEMEERRERLAMEERFRDFAQAGSDWFWETDARDHLVYLAGPGGTGARLPNLRVNIGDHVMDWLTGPSKIDQDENAEFVSLFLQRKACRKVRGVRQTDEGRIAVERSGTPRFSEDGKFLGYRGVTADISDLAEVETEQRKLSERLAHAQRLKAIGQLAGGVAHDFNNLLAVIQGNVELAQLDPNSDDVPHFLSMAHAASVRGASLTRKLLAYSRQQPLAPKHIDASAMLGDLKDVLSRPLGEQIELRIKAVDDLMAIFADQNQLETVLFNLALNARDAMPRGGQLTISAENMRELGHSPDGLPPGDYVVLSVSDTGTGMDQATAVQAFEPFFTTKDVGQGSGLGLSMAFGFAEQSNGSISLDTAPDMGTQVTLTLPTSLLETERAKDTKAPKDFAGVRILLVEDDVGVLRTLSGYLKSMNCSVRTASNAQEAIDLVARGHDFDGYIFDVVLPDALNGFELAHELRETYGAINVLFMSGHTFDAERAASAESKSAQILKKPFSRGALAEALVSLLEVQASDTRTETVL